MSPGALVEVEHLCLAYGQRTVLDDVSFTIAPGEFTGLIGSNGVGKTTLLKVLLGLERPQSGTVRIGGQLVRRSPKKVGYVPQKVQLDPEVPLRTRDFIALGLDGSRLGIWPRSKEHWRRVDAMVEAVDASSFATTRIGNLSGGQQQRALIAHALIAEPGLLVLDEPLANLDPRSVEATVSLLEEISTTRGVSIVLSAHEMNPLLRVMDRIVYLTDGRAASGTTDEVVRSEVLSRLYGHHVDVLRLHGRVLVVAEPNAATDQLESHDPVRYD